MRSETWFAGSAEIIGLPVSFFLKLVALCLAP
jgi:hypothetical protein